MNALANPAPIHPARPHAWSVDPVVEERYWQQYLAVRNRLTFSLEWVTPAVAAAVLEKANTHNRPKSVNALVRLVKDVLKGSYFLNGEPVVFDWNGNLLDGQHRLSAVVKTGVSLPLAFVRGVDPDAFPTFDQGKGRNGADVLAMLGNAQGVRLMAAIRWLRKYDDGKMETTETIEIRNSDVGAALDLYPGLNESVHYVRNQTAGLITPAAAAFLHYKLTRFSSEAARLLFEKFYEGVGIVRPSHEYLLRRALENSGDDHRVRAEIERCAIVIETFNRVINGTPPSTNERTHIRWTFGRIPFPVIGGAPHIWRKTKSADSADGDSGDAS